MFDWNKLVDVIETKTATQGQWYTFTDSNDNKTGLSKEALLQAVSGWMKNHWLENLA